MENKRLTNIDLLKIISIISVIFIHVSSVNIFDLRYTRLVNNNFLIINFYNIITRFCVPCFLMITGMFLLDKDISIKTIYKKYILRIAIVYIIFSLIYSIFQHFYEGKNFFRIFIMGYYHLWYLYLLIGLYIVTPILRKIVKDKKITRYFLILCLIFTSIIPIINEFMKLYEFKVALNYLNINITLGYVGYFIAGYYFSKYEVNNKVFYCLGFLGFILNYYMYFILSYNSNLYTSIFLMPGTVFESIAVFLFFNTLKIKENKVITYISSLTFGIYLVHVLVMKLILIYYPLFIYNYSIISIPILSILIFVISLLMSVTLNNIPLLKKFYKITP